MKRYLILIVLLIHAAFVMAQVAINDNGSSPATSAMLDVQSQTKGMLIPRMTANQRDAINNPEQGLMVFVTDDNNFYYFKKDSWIKVGKGAAGWTKNGNYIATNDSVAIGTNAPEAPLEVHGFILQRGTGRSVFIGDSAGLKNDTSADNYNIGLGYQTLTYNTTGKYNVAIGNYSLFSNGIGSNNVGIGVSALTMNEDVDNNTAVGRLALATNISGTKNTSAGFSSLCLNITGNNNTAAGDSALYSNNSNDNTALGAGALTKNGSSGGYNTAMGYHALWQNTTGDYNTAIGSMTLENNTTGMENTAFGDWSLKNNESGSDNTAVGNEALMNLLSGNNNTAIGNQAGHQLTNGTGNVFIGNKAGYFETGSNRLYIDNSDTAKPLIGGDFSANKVYLNGKVGIGTSSPNELLEVADTNSSGSYPARMIVSDGQGSQRRALLFVSPNVNSSNTRARIESYNYGDMAGCNLEVNRVGEGKTMFYGDTYIDGLLKLGSYSKGNYPPKAGMIRWNDIRKDYEGFTGTEWVSLTRQANGWGKQTDVVPVGSATADDGDTNDRFGCSVSVSENGYIFVGAENKKVGNSLNSGGIYIYQFQNGSWVFNSSIDNPSGLEYEFFGRSVSNDGDRAVVGAWYALYDGIHSGIVRKFRRDPYFGWQEAQYLISPDYADGDVFGESVSISGYYVIVGAPQKNALEGEAYIFNFENDNCQEILSNPNSDCGYFGTSVSVSGYYAVASSDGNAYVYKRVVSTNDTSWILQDSLNRAGGVAIDGDYIIVGGNNDTAYVFHRNGTGWDQQAVIAPSYGLSYGSHVSLSGDYAILSCFNSNLSGACIFHHVGSSWIQDKIITAADATVGDYFGSSVSISSFHAVVGAPEKDVNGISNQGKVYFINY